MARAPSRYRKPRPDGDDPAPYRKTADRPTYSPPPRTEPFERKPRVVAKKTVAPERTPRAAPERSYSRESRPQRDAPARGPRGDTPFRSAPRSEEPYNREKYLAKPKKKRSGKKREWTPGIKKTKPLPPKPEGGAERVQKLITAAGLASRREAEEWIAQGRVQVNGKTIKLGDQATVKDEITVNGAPIEFPKKLYFVLHKPKGYVTTRDDKIYKKQTVMELIPVDERIYPVGRLDKDTTGVLLFTNDGDFANRVMHPSYETKKTYIATLETPFDRRHVRTLEEGVRLKEGIVRCSVRVLTPRKIEITLHQGFNHVVKRVMKEVGYWVTDLARVRVGSVKLDIPLGAYRPLTSKEIEGLLHAAS
jgi:23S rRNA pseudouridine2605 synthase